MSKNKVLVIEDDDRWLKIFKILVGDYTENLFDYTYVKTLHNAICILSEGKFDLIILDLMLPDSQANNTIEVASIKMVNYPVVIITTLDDEKLISNALKKGIQDYLVKDQYDINTFIHVCRLSIKRFIAKMSSSIEEGLKDIIDNLSALDEKLSQHQNNN